MKAAGLLRPGPARASLARETIPLATPNRPPPRLPPRPADAVRRARGRLPRSLLASASVHVALLGTGVLLGFFELSGSRSPVRTYSARFESARPPELPSSDLEALEPLEPLEPAEPELLESEVWAEPLTADYLPEPVPEPEAAAIDWVAEARRRPFVLAGLGPPEAEAQAETLPDAVADLVPAPSAVPAPSVADPVPLEVPSPPYPRLARRAGEQGTVLLRLELDPEGRVARVEVLESSGFERLDRAARETLAGWRFEPRREDGRAVASSVLHRVTFRLGAS